MNILGKFAKRCDFCTILEMIVEHIFSIILTSVAATPFQVNLWWESSKLLLPSSS